MFMDNLKVNEYLCRQINRNLCASRMQSQARLSYAEAQPSQTDKSKFMCKPNAEPSSLELC